MSRPTNIHDVPETQAIFERQLPDGSSLEYHMQVLQQPERARACGMGAKSHADRRPVDPPPVVELKLFQTTGNERADVTFSHNSNFFLFATLEQARPVAQGRGMTAPAPAPVLTGVPVSGMAYLDRPAPAGYFIFPDLSVRHEGRYRLRFALYEETKEEAYSISQDPHEPREFCTHRLDVKSKAFTVFSAKKFPGLAESTALSRIVAEQGCRVRIRRDVRMRRRTDRPRGRDSEDSMDETAMLRAQRGRTPDQYDIENRIKPQAPQHAVAPQYRQPPPPYPLQRSDSTDNRKRSGSDASLASLPEVSPHGSRYNNGGYMPPAQNHGPYRGHPVVAQQPPPTANQHLAFGGNTHSAPPPAPPSQSYPPQIQSQEIYGRTGYADGPHSRQYPGPPVSYHGSRESSAPVPGPPSIPRRESVDEYHRSRRDSEVGYHAPSHYRPSTPSVPQQPQYNNQMQNGYSHQQYGPSSHPQSQYAQSQPPALPPLRLPPMEPRVSWESQPATPSATGPSQSPYPPAKSGPTPQPQRNTPAPPSIAPSTPNPNQFVPYYSEQSKYTSTPNSYGPIASSPPPPPPPESSKKRTWGRVFNTAHTEGAMYNKMRPDGNSDLYGVDPLPFPPVDVEEEENYDDINKLRMTYRRADGVEIVRKLAGEL